jgi:beta-glucosidase
MDQDVPRYDQFDPAIEARLDDLLRQMTLAEKVGQLTQPTAFAPLDSDELAKLMAEAQESGASIQGAFKPRPELEDQIREGRVGSLFNLTDVRQVNHYQRVAVEQSRLGIPLIVGHDVIHGYRTIFPIPLAESCT